MSEKHAPDNGTLQQWLDFIEALHNKPIDLGLGRMHLMIGRLGIRFSCPVFTVAGTNGKGSTCAFIESVLRHAGYRVGMHTSPHLIRFNERLLIDGKEVDDDTLIGAFRAVESARAGMTLSYFEYTGLAILKILCEAGLDAVILEIGLGGRLDAMNAVDTDCGIVCAIGIDHVAFLGNTREKIAFEKAGIYRAGRPAVCTDCNPTETLVEHARRIGAPLFVCGRDFKFVPRRDGLLSFVLRQTDGTEFTLENVPQPALAGANQLQNAAGALCALALMRERFPRFGAGVAGGFTDIRMTGRFQVIKPEDGTGAELTIDVGHNPNAAEALLANLQATARPGCETWAVFGMLADKDMASVARIVSGAVDRWFVASLTGPRAADADQLCDAMRQGGVDMSRVSRYHSVAEALHEALESSRCALARRGAHTVKIIGFGSFVTVAGVIGALGSGAAEDIFP